MALAEAIVLGILQGIIEWLPVSSEAVLTLVMTQLFGADTMDAVNTAIWLHTGTMLAALLYFRSEFTTLTRNAVSAVTEWDGTGSGTGASSGNNLLWFIILATALTGVVGGTIYVLGLKTVAEYPKLFSAVMGIALLLTGVLRLYATGAERTADTVTLEDATVAGILQGFSILPGISRSGSTVFALLFRGFDGDDAFRLSFLMSVPAVFAANIGLNLFADIVVSMDMLIAAVTAFIVSYGAIDAMLAVADRAGVAYLCFVLAALSFVPVVL